MRYAFALLLCSAASVDASGLYGTTGTSPTGVAPQSYLALQGSGSTLQAKFMYRMLALMDLRTLPSTSLRFRAIGSGGGRKEIGSTSGGVPNVGNLSAVNTHFASTDFAMSAAENGMSAGVPSFLHFPVVATGVGVFHNVPVAIGGAGVLRLTRCALNDIYSGRCVTWDCAVLAGLNPGLSVPPGQPIRLVARADSSGTSQVFSAWLASGSSQAGPNCVGYLAPGETIASHPFGPAASPWAAPGANNPYFFGMASSTPVWPGGTPPPGYSLSLQSGSQAVADFINATQWSLGYVDAGQGQAYPLQEAAILNPAGAFVRSQDTSPTLSVPVLPYPDGSTPSNSTPTNTAWPAVTLLDSPVAGAFPVSTLSYVVVPSSFASYTSPSYTAEAAGLLLALLQQIYNPETTVGYNYACGYSNGALVLSAPPGGVLPAYNCTSYTAPSILAGFNFSPLPLQWMTVVRTALAFAAAPASGGGPMPVLGNGSLFSTAAALSPVTFASPWAALSLSGVPIPSWSFEPTEKALPASAAAGAPGSGERVISYARMSYTDFLFTSSAEREATQSTAVATLQATVFGSDRTVVYLLQGAGSSAAARLIWRALDLLNRRTPVGLRAGYRAVGSGRGMADFAGVSNGYMSGSTFAVSKTPLPTGAPGCPVPAATRSCLLAAGVRVLTLPISVSAISVFHSIPPASLPSGAPLNLTASSLCAIFTGGATAWYDASIAASNPALVAPLGTPPICVVVRADASGTTAVFSAWLAASCGAFGLTPGMGGAGSAAPAWSADFSFAYGTEGVLSHLAGGASSPPRPWCITFADAGAGLDAGVAEAALELAPGSGVFGQASRMGASALAVLAGLAFPSPGDDWAAPANAVAPALLNQWAGPASGTAQVWPCVALSYLLLRADQTGSGESGRLAAALVRMMLSFDAGTPVGSPDEVPASPLKYYSEFLRAQPPAAVVASSFAALASVLYTAGTSDYTFENYYATGRSSLTGLPTGTSAVAGFAVSPSPPPPRMLSVWRGSAPDYVLLSDAEHSRATSRAAAAAAAAAASQQAAALDALWAAVNASAVSSGAAMSRAAGGSTRCAAYTEGDVIAPIALAVALCCAGVAGWLWTRVRALEAAAAARGLSQVSSLTAMKHAGARSPPPTPRGAHNGAV